MRYSLNTPLGRLGVDHLEESPDRCVASIPVGGLLNPLTGSPTIAPLAMLVDHIGGTLNHNRRGPDQWTVTSELALELAPHALAIINATPEVPVFATARAFGSKGNGSLSLCELSHGGVAVATATVRSVYIQAPDHFHEWPDTFVEGDLAATLAERLAVRIAEGGGRTKVLQQLSDPEVNNTIGIVHGGASAAALELVASAALNDEHPETPLQTASLRVNYLRQFRGGDQSRYEGTAFRVGRSTGVADAQAIGADGKVALLARITAYR